MNCTLVAIRIQHDRLPGVVGHVLDRLAGDPQSVEAGHGRVEVGHVQGDARQTTTNDSVTKRPVSMP